MPYRAIQYAAIRPAGPAPTMSLVDDQPLYVCVDAERDTYTSVFEWVVIDAGCCEVAVLCC